MEKEIRIRIAADGKVEIDSTVFEDCKEISDKLSSVLGKVESFTEKDSHDIEERIKIGKK